ncbi:MAG: hypothetical protein COB66_07730 [Coxiella sp. (in: Bacteria)]|nr:MAG: hypothetical protein COB66_07730 [Coxiella sp. (in: g-proteobacteria)]
MTGLINRLEVIEKEQLEDMEFFESEYGDDPQYDEDGGLSTSKKGIKRFVALCDYKLRHDIPAFRKNLRGAVELRKSLFDRYNQGESIDESFVTMNAFDYLLDALASGDYKLSEDFAKVMGGREKIEKENDHPFDWAFGYALKAAILDQEEELDTWLALASKEVKHPDVKFYQGYVDALYAIRKDNDEAFESAIKQLLKDHRKECREGGVFDNCADEVVCFGGLGLVNLARLKGLKVIIDDEYLPSELVV